MVRQRLKQVLLTQVLLKRNGIALALWGEPGIGKSYAVAHRLRETPCLSLSLRAATPLADLVSQLPKPAGLPGWAHATLTKVENGVPVEPPRLVEAMAASIARTAPFVLHIEDLHEVDEVRLQLFRDLAAMAKRSRGVGLIVTSRTEPDGPFERVRLEPLSQAQTRELVEDTLGSRLPAEAAEWIAGWAKGNPLFALEYLRFLSRQGHLWSDGSTWHWRRPNTGEAPPTVEALIEFFLRDVAGEPHQSALLKAKAVLPTGATADLLATAAGLTAPQLRSASQQLERRGVLTQGTFVHPLYLDVAQKMVPPGERAEMARRALAASTDVLQKAALIEDAEVGPAEAVVVLKLAADASRAAGDDLQAAHLLIKASRHVQGEEAGRLALEAAKLLEGKDYPLMLELATTASTSLADPTEALVLQATGHAVRGDTAGMQHVLAQLPATAKRDASWLDRHVSLLHQAGMRQELITAWEASPFRERCDAQTVHFVGWAYLHSGATRVAATLVDQRLALEAPDSEGASSLKELQASIAFYGGSYEKADTTYSELLESLLGSGSAPDHHVANLLRNRAVARMQLSRHATSLPDLKEALRLYEKVGHGLNHAKTLVMMSYAYLELGLYERTEEVLHEALETVQRSGSKLFLSDILSQLSDLYLERLDRPHASLALKYARQASQAASAQPGGVEDVTARCLLSRAETATGRADLGLDLAGQAMAAASSMEIPEALVAAHFALACAYEASGEVDEARGAYAAAARAADGYELAVHANRYGLEVDRLDGDQVTAAGRLRWFEERELHHGANVARHYFPALAPVRLREPQGQAPTPRLEVLGPMRLRRGDQTAPVRGRRRQVLLLTLLEARIAGRAELARLELLETLYPGSDETRAAANLKQIVSELRKELGASSIRTTTTGYALGELSSDAEAFLETGDTTSWRDVYGDGVDLVVSESVTGRLYSSLFADAEALLESDDLEASRLAEILRRHDPYDHAFLRLHLLSLQRSQRVSAMVEAYSGARAHLSDVGETLPDHWSEFLARTARSTA